jgi:pyridoxine/pyridoxamine 5'-phosphate oxidase
MAIEINEGIKNMIEENAMSLATISKNGNPHNIAVAYVKVVSKDEVVISNNYIVETIENIKSNENVSLVVWHKNWKNTSIGYELQGRARDFTEGKWLEFVKKLPINKDEPTKGAILIKINKIKSLV